MEEAKFLLKIMKCYLKNEDAGINENIDENKLYKLARKHLMSNFLYNWSVKNAKSAEIKNAIKTDYITQIFKDTNENIELKKILDEFEKENIQTVIVKGAVMKDIYPENYMRQMCDIDILVHESDFKKATKIMENLKFSKFYNHEKHLIFTKGQYITVEMHRKLILQRDSVAHDYFLNIWSQCEKYREYKNILVLNVDDAYIFCILHLLIHFKFNGILMKDLLDVYLYNEKYKNVMNYDKIFQKFKDFGIVEFEKNIKSIAYKWFSAEEIENFDEVEKFILKGANITTQINYSVSKNDKKSKYLLKLFFPEFDIMKEKYPVLNTVPVLLPFTWIARIFKDIFSKETTLQTRFDTIKLINSANQEDIENIKKIYEKLGIEEKNTQNDS